MGVIHRDRQHPIRRIVLHCEWIDRPVKMILDHPDSTAVVRRIEEAAELTSRLGRFAIRHRSFDDFQLDTWARPDRRRSFVEDDDEAAHAAGGLELKAAQGSQAPIEAKSPAAQGFGSPAFFVAATGPAVGGVD